jgi:hypothetical protein
MRTDWNALARENARHYVQNATVKWNEQEFFRSINLANDVMPKMLRICGGTRSPLDLNVLEIGCNDAKADPVQPAQAYPEWDTTIHNF